MFGIVDKLYGRSSQWRRVRAEHLKENPCCAACGRKDNLHVHHIVPYHLNPDLELEPSNLITLCGKYCHFVFGHLMDWKSWNENVVRDSTLYLLAKRHRPYREVFGTPPKEWYNAVFNFIFSFLPVIFKRYFGRHD